MKIYTPLKWVLLSIVILIICSHSHANQTPFGTGHDYHLPNQTHDQMGTQPTKSKHTQVKLTPPVVISGVLCFLAASISNAGGIGGGGLFITILTLVARLDLKTASSFSAFMVTGGSIASVMYHMISASPKYGAKSLIDHDICFLSEPVMLLGVSIGVMCNVMFPEWLITILCSAFLAWSTFKTITCGVGKWKSETGERKKKGPGETENGLVRIDGNCGGCGVEINKESGLSGSVVGLESRLVVVGQDGNFGGNGLEINEESGLSGKLVESFEQGNQWRKLGGLMVIWFSFFVLRLFTGNRYGQSLFCYNAASSGIKARTTLVSMSADEVNGANPNKGDHSIDALWGAFEKQQQQSEMQQQQLTEIHNLLAGMNLNQPPIETEGQLVTRFVDGLRANIQDIVTMQPVHTLQDAIQLATRAESQLRRRGGSSENIVSRTMVDKLGLQRQKHPSPYSIGWIRDVGETKVTEQCIVPFSIGKDYKDEVVCDVVDMDACHMLLGRPWQYDLNTTHKGKDNTYTFYKNKVKVVLAPMRREGRVTASPAKADSFLIVPDIMKEAKETQLVYALVVKCEAKEETVVPNQILWKDLIGSNQGRNKIKSRKKY
ncbi:hypothetical protein RHSIM_Rhsim02G0114600 [Rhododendron simsii]|uniref:Sulfite exporter TauE/SafE family protein n=1 Tax=Rhododendron simsii TaxID=118357 RepID=A0A834LV42_RHOSS|nr:hypothetical protein RHSIM_Rhsim02G0114600 [Rhododendron simsii]